MRVIQSLREARHEIAATIIHDAATGQQIHIILAHGTSDSVCRDFDAALCLAEKVTENGGEPVISCYHNHPAGSTAPSYEDTTNHWDYQQKTEGHGFIWGGGYIVTAQAVTQFA